MKKLVVKDSCIGCGACVAVDPEHFDFNEKSFSEVIKNDNLDTDELKNAMSSCPVNAIKIEDNEDGHCEGCDGCHCEKAA